MAGPLNTRSRRFWWEVRCKYWSVRRGLLNWSFNQLDAVRRRLMAEQRPAEPPEPDAVVLALADSVDYMTTLAGGPYYRFSLRRGRSVLATLVMYGADWPWNHCYCTFTEAFETVRSEFEEFHQAALTMGTPAGEKAWRKARNRMRRLKLKLVPLEVPKWKGPSPTLLYIDREKARFRESNSWNMTSWPW